MARRSHRRRQLILPLGVVSALMLPALPAWANECWYEGDPPTLICDDGGGGGGGEEPPGPTWTAWTLVGPCGGGGGIGGGLIDINTGLLAAVRQLIGPDDTILDSQLVCIDLDDGETEAWDEVASAVEALPDPEWHSNPDDAIAPGLTGLETWIWYDQATGVGPLTATWVEPVTGLVFGVEGRGWTETVTWDTADGHRYDVFAATWEDHPDLGGSESEPPVSHVYRTKSSAAGHSAGYPVGVELLWVGEYRVSVLGIWTDWARFGSTLTETVTGTYNVVEVRSDLSG